MLNFLITRAAWLYLYFVGITSKILWKNLEIRRDLEKKEKNFIYAFWHGRQLIFPWAYRNENACTIVSQSKDGELIAQVIHKFGLGTIRGSSSKGASRALLELIDALKEGKTVAFTPDGPRGPQREVAPGILYTAQKSGKPILPITYSAKYKIIIRGWDNYWVPLPFNTIVINYGNPIYIQPQESLTPKGEGLKNELDRITQICDRYWRSSSREKLYYFLYNLFLETLSPFILLSFLLKQPKRFFSQCFIGLRSRSGFLSQASLKANGTPVWMHAPSIGECKAAFPFVNGLRTKFPNINILFTTNTLTGLSQAKSLHLGDSYSLAPMDFPFVLKRFFNGAKPKIFFMIESEIWPNRLRMAKKLGIKICLINGRISEKSTRKYLLSKTFSQIVLNHIDRFCLREEKDYKRFLDLGVDQEKMALTGNLKLDFYLNQKSEHPSQGCPKSPFSKQNKVWTAASVRPGELKIIIETFRTLKEEFPELKLILAPRHLEELDSLRKILQANLIHFCSRSVLNQFKASDEAILWDSYGDLETAYHWSNLVFVGGSFVPVGGHNPIEPSTHGKPVLFGPHMENFFEVAQHLIRMGGAIQVKDLPSLTDAIRNLLKEDGKIQKMGSRAKEAIDRVAGNATRDTIAFIEPILNSLTHA